MLDAKRKTSKTDCSVSYSNQTRSIEWTRLQLRQMRIIYL